MGGWKYWRFKALFYLSYVLFLLPPSVVKEDISSILLGEYIIDSDRSNYLTDAYKAKVTVCYLSNPLRGYPKNAKLRL